MENVKYVNIDWSSFPELPGGEWVLFAGRPTPGILYLGPAFQWRRCHSGDMGSVWLCSRPALKPPPCRWHGDGEPVTGLVRPALKLLPCRWHRDRGPMTVPVPGPQTYIRCGASACAYGPVRPTKGEAILAWNEMMSDGNDEGEKQCNSL